MTPLSDFVSSAALYALSFEANVTPKPGLVDRRNTGSHNDMTLSMLLKSAHAISPFIGHCAQSGLDTRLLSHEEAFCALKAIGLQAEAAMKKETGGVNTHKGAIFSFCLLAGAFGRLSPFERTREKICLTAAPLSQKASGAALENARSHPVTHGDIAYKTASLTGARGEALSGYPGILTVALPALEYALQKGFCENDAGVYALLSLISRTADTCLYARGGSEGLSLAMQLSKAALEGDFMSESAKIDSIFIQKRLSPGGCADLLAAAMFIKKLTQS